MCRKYSFFFGLGSMFFCRSLGFASLHRTRASSGILHDQCQIIVHNKYWKDTKGCYRAKILLLSQGVNQRLSRLSRKDLRIARPIW